MAGPSVMLELGGKERRLRFDLNAVAEIGERLDITVRLDELGKDLMSKPLPLSALRILLWAGLRHEDSELTPETVGSWVDQDNIREVAERFFTLFDIKFSGMDGLKDMVNPTSKEGNPSEVISPDLKVSPTALSA